MAIKGYFESHHPLSPAFVIARVLLPRFSLESKVEFLLDTGGRETILGASAILDFGLDYAQLRKDPMVEIGGLTGSGLFYEEEAEVILVDQNGDVYSFNVNIAIPQPSGSEKLPSIMGRDILNRCDLRLSFNFGIVDVVGPSRAKLSSPGEWLS